MGLAIIGEEYGEACQAAIESHCRGGDRNLMYQEILSVAATAMRFAIDFQIQKRCGVGA